MELPCPASASATQTESTAVTTTEATHVDQHPVSPSTLAGVAEGLASWTRVAGQQAKRTQRTGKERESYT